MGPGDMDREQREHYRVVIEAKDMAGHRGGLTGTTVVYITLTDVNDNTPRFTHSKTLSFMYVFVVVIVPLTYTNQKLADIFWWWNTK